MQLSVSVGNHLFAEWESIAAQAPARRSPGLSATLAQGWQRHLGGTQILRQAREACFASLSSTLTSASGCGRSADFLIQCRSHDLERGFTPMSCAIASPCG